MQIENERWLRVIFSVLALVFFTSCLEKEQASTQDEAEVSPTSGVEAQREDGRVAMVNGSVITLDDIDRDMRSIQERFARTGRYLSGPQLSEARKEVLKNLINRELLYQESQRRGIAVDEATVKEHMEKLERQFPDEAELKNLLEKMNLSKAEMSAQIKKGIAIHQFVEQEFVKNLVVSEEETEAYYNSNLELFNKPEMVQASHILIKLDPQADESQRAEAQKRIVEIQAKLEKGGDFEDLAREFSQGPTSANSGDLGYFGRGQMVKPFEEAAFALSPGEVSGIVETKFGFHLIKAGNKRPASTANYKDVKEKIEKYLKQKKAGEEISLYTEKLEKKADLVVFMPEYLE
ncbi:MAG: peptidylprolyl isomerase [Thermodesulfobacteriota bacterium]|nr:peptidylprolyl isomerase [Thermodesulfobacteriota bacterium]